MNRDRLRALPFVVAMLFLLFAFARPQARAVWIVLAAAFVVVGAVWRRRREPPANPPGA